MISIQKVVASFVLAAPALLAAPQDLQLSYDQDRHIAHLGANVDAEVLVVFGPRANPVIHIETVDVLVQPQLVVPFGLMAAGDRIDVPVPSEVDGMGFQLVGVDLTKFTLIASQAVFFDLRDLIDRSFRASLVLTGEANELHVTLTAPTSGYSLNLDGFDLLPNAARVWLRLEVPNPAEVVMPVLTELNLVVKLPLVLGPKVEVNMARDVRGTVVLPTYKLMAVLDSHPNPLQ